MLGSWKVSEFFRQRGTDLVWPDDAREYVEYRQETAYRLLGDRIGIGDDPEAVRQKLIGKRPSTVKLSPEALRDKLGLTEKFGRKDWARMKRLIARDEASPTLTPPATRFEDPITYRLMYEVRRIVNDDIRRFGTGTKFPVFLASLPSGDMNARISPVPKTKQPILFFEQGLFQFLRDFAALASWAAPELPPEGYTDPVLVAIAQKHTMPVPASELFGSSLYSYVVEGNPGVGAPRVPPPEANAYLMEVLFIWMMKFVFLHEFAHIVHGDLEKTYTSRDASWNCEYSADISAVGFLTEVSGITDNWGLAFWACDLVLIAFNFLDRALALFEFGGGIKWISETHPQSIERRRMLHACVPPNVPDRARKAGGNLAAMDEAMFQRLWEITVPQFMYERSRGARPSPLWSERIARSMVPVS